jgi:hypothetical protein
MSTTKRLSGSYTIQTLGTAEEIKLTSDVVTLDAPVTNVTGDLTVVGNAVLTGNINADRIFYGTSNVEIPSLGGNVTVSVGGSPNIAVFSTGGANVTGFATASGRLTGSEVFTDGVVSAAGNVTGGNVRTPGNILITRDAGLGTPTIQMSSNNTAEAAGAVLGSLEWFTSDTTGLGARVTAAVRATTSDTAGNVNVAIFTNSSTSTSRVHINGITGNVGVANIAPLHQLAVSGTMWGSSTFTAVGNVVGGNITTSGQVSATANVTGGNVNTAGRVSATGNINGGNIISSGAISAGSAGILATGNITGGNILSQGIISAVGNLTTTDIFATSISVSGSVTGGNAVLGNANVTSTVSAANVIVTSNLSGDGVGVQNIVVQAIDDTVSSATPANVGNLQFSAVANNRYWFDAYVPMVPDGSMTISPAVNFSAGTCYYTTETQTTSTSAWSVATKTTSDDVATTYASTGTTARGLRFSGTFFHTSNVVVALRLQNSTGNITVPAGSYLTYTRTS